MTQNHRYRGQGMIRSQLMQNQRNHGQCVVSRQPIKNFGNQVMMRLIVSPLKIIWFVAMMSLFYKRKIMESVRTHLIWHVWCKNDKGGCPAISGGGIFQKRGDFGWGNYMLNLSWVVCRWNISKNVGQLLSGTLGVRWFHILEKAIREHLLSGYTFHFFSLFFTPHKRPVTYYFSKRTLILIWWARWQ